MAKPSYAFEKRQRDLAKKKKREEKRRRKLEKGNDSPQNDSSEPAGEEIKSHIQDS